MSKDSQFQRILYSGKFKSGHSVSNVNSDLNKLVVLWWEDISSLQHVATYLLGFNQSCSIFLKQNFKN